MQYCAVYHRWASFTSSLDTVLENGLSHACKRIGNNQGGDEVIRVQYQDVVRIINDTLTSAVELPNYVHVGAFSAASLDPRLAEGDYLVELGLFIFDEQNLPSVN